jgi:glycosyltransferase involved in cell wall biosynthesis
VTAPRVTVIIPTWNWSAVLPHSIGSVLGQTFADFELLVIGDGCTDDSESVVRASDDPRVRWIDIARTGHQSGPNNEGLRQARGELVAYLGHDDLWLPQHLSALVAAVDRGAELVHSRMALIAADNAVTIAPASWRAPSSTLHRRAIAVDIGGWRNYRDLSATPEADLWQRLAAAGARVELVPRVTAIKFPAGWRRDVYRERPSHEQAAWLARIGAEPGLEAELAAARSSGFADRLLRLVGSPSLWFSFLWRRRGARIRAWQRFKGVK